MIDKSDWGGGLLAFLRDRWAIPLILLVAGSPTRWYQLKMPQLFKSQDIAAQRIVGLLGDVFWQFCTCSSVKLQNNNIGSIAELK